MKEPQQSDEAFLADVEQTPRDPARLDLWWLGQSGYLVQWDRHRLVIDPYLSESLTKKYHGSEKPHVRMTRRVVDPARLSGVTIVTSSHQHTDHLDSETLAAIVTHNPSMSFVCPRAWRELAEERLGRAPDVLLDAGESVRIDGVELTAVAAAHDTLDRDADGFHKYLGFVVRAGRFAIYHSGDTVVYDGMVERLRPFAVDLAILPINGKVGNMNGTDAARLAHAIGAKAVLPCHYDMFEFNTANPHHEFEHECRRLGQRFVILRQGQHWTLN